MRRITLWFAGTAALVVLLFTYRTSTSGPGQVTASSAYAPGVVADPGQPSSATGGPAPHSSTDAVVNGSVAQTRWGPVQVQVRISGGHIADVVVLQQPNGNRTDQEINSYAIPELRQQVLQVQGAEIDGVSGATVTSDGYRESLQSALNTVHFGR